MHNADGKRGLEAGDSEDGLEQLSHSFIGYSVSLLPQDQDFGVAVGCEVEFAFLEAVWARRGDIHVLRSLGE